MQFWDTKQNAWSYIITTMTGYRQDGKLHYAFCLEADKDGVGEANPYTVDVTEVLSDVRVWRTIISGFPYKTPAQLGVENEFDAFVATKQAVYSIIYERDVNSFYRGGDERGVKILNAINNMVNEGRYGTRTPQSANVTINKVNEFKEEGNYYSQEFSVSSVVNIDSYIVNSTAGLPEGTLITNMNNNAQSNFGGSEHFKVLIPKDKLNADIESVISVQARCETYPIFVGKAPASNLQDYALTFDPFGDESGVVEFNLKTNTGMIAINKTDDETSQPIAGVTFELSKEDGTVVANATTNEQGIATFSALYQGKYILKEVSTNEKYILNEQQFDVDVIYNQKTELNIQNEHKKGDLKIFKVDKDNNKIGLGNVEFDLFSEEFNRVIGTYRTNVDGEITIENLRIGNYKLIEKNTNKWYNLAEDKEVKVEWNNVTNTTVENELKKAQIKVIKIDQDNNEVKLQGVTFEVIDENDNVLEKIVTDSNGEALTSRYPVRDFKELKIREVETLENYVLQEEPQTIKLEENQIHNVTFTNEKKKGQIKVIKIDLDNREVKLEGVEFKVYDEQGNVVDTLITDSNGEAISKELPIDQTYTVQESRTLENYVLQEEPKKVILQQDQISELQFENEKVKGYISITKSSSENNEYSGLAEGTKLEGAEFEIYDSNNILVDTIITDSNGVATSKELLKGKYTIKEIKAPLYYVVNENTFETEIINHQETVNVDITDDNVDIDVDVEKTGFVETQSGDTIYYDFSNIKNNSNIYLDTFCWQDTLPINAVRLEKIFTGTWNQDLTYSVWYKTNLSDYKMIRENLSTNVNYEIDFTNLELQEGEYITDYEFRFGKVNIGFREVETPRVYCKVLDDLDNGFTFTNNTKVYGTYHEKYVEDEDKWTTIIYNKDIELTELPRTGC